MTSLSRTVFALLATTAFITNGCSEEKVKNPEAIQLQQVAPEAPYTPPKEIQKLADHTIAGKHHRKGESVFSRHTFKPFNKFGQQVEEVNDFIELVKLPNNPEWKWIQDQVSTADQLNGLLERYYGEIHYKGDMAFREIRYHPASKTWDDWTAWQSVKEIKVLFQIERNKNGLSMKIFSRKHYPWNFLEDDFDAKEIENLPK